MGQWSDELMAIDNFDSGIRSVTHTTSPSGQVVEMDPVEWSKNDYFVNLQHVEEVEEPEVEAKAPTMKRARRKKPPAVSKEKPQQVGEELVDKAHKKDLRRRGLS